MRVPYPRHAPRALHSQSTLTSNLHQGWQVVQCDQFFRTSKMHLADSRPSDCLLCLRRWWQLVPFPTRILSSFPLLQTQCRTTCNEQILFHVRRFLPVHSALLPVLPSQRASRQATSLCMSPLLLLLRVYSLATLHSQDHSLLPCPPFLHST